METSSNDTGFRILNLRKDRGYTREQLAELAGISSKFLYEIEIKGKRFSSTTLEHLADALEVSCDYVLKGKKNTNLVDELAMTIEQFEPDRLKQIKELLKIAYELTYSDGKE